ncbi:MAG: RES family NAD+ phosphorylase [Alphaproteobacteria bacterium]|nr:RES family NAD+ phosphorylase [Alphaproteobacteria bacterium SS10]
MSGAGADGQSITKVNWPRAVRVIYSIYPPIDLFEDIADPEDWDAIASAEAKTNPRLVERIGRLDLVPPERRVGGTGASYLMAPFVHCSTDRPGRFTDGNFGIYSTGNSDEVAIREVAYHHGLAMADSQEEPGWTAQFRQLVGAIDTDLVDLRGKDEFHKPDDYHLPQKIGATLRQQGFNGIVYDSVRCPGGECAGLFWPDLIAPPRQGDHYRFHWDGTQVDRFMIEGSNDVFSLID